MPTRCDWSLVLCQSAFIVLYTVPSHPFPTDAALTDSPLASNSTFRAMLALALPVLAEESLNLLVGYTDFFLAGRFLKGDDPLAAMGLVAYFLWVLPVLFQVVSIGALAVVARMVGGGQRQDAATASRQALIDGI